MAVVESLRLDKALVEVILVTWLLAAAEFEGTLPPCTLTDACDPDVCNPAAGAATVELVWGAIEDADSWRGMAVSVFPAAGALEVSAVLEGPWT